MNVVTDWKDDSVVLGEQVVGKEIGEEAKNFYYDFDLVSWTRLVKISGVGQVLAVVPCH